MELLLASIVVLLGALSVAQWARQRRQRRQLAALLERLDELEGRLGRELADEPGEAVREVHRTGPGTAPAASRDVLAGRTSHVRRIVAGEEELVGLADHAIAAIHRLLGGKITPARLADEVHVSLRTLERGLRASLDCTPSQLVLAVQMREARRQLLRGDVRVSDLAYRLGFSSPSHFSSRFRAFYRLAPSEVAAEGRERQGRRSS